MKAKFILSIITIASTVLFANNKVIEIKPPPKYVEVKKPDIYIDLDKLEETVVLRDNSEFKPEVKAPSDYIFKKPEVKNSEIEPQAKFKKNFRILGVDLIDGKLNVGLSEGKNIKVEKTEINPDTGETSKYFVTETNNTISEYILNPDTLSFEKDIPFSWPNSIEIVEIDRFGILQTKSKRYSIIDRHFFGDYIAYTFGFNSMFHHVFFPNNDINNYKIINWFDTLITKINESSFFLGHIKAVRKYEIINGELEKSHIYSNTANFDMVMNADHLYTPFITSNLFDDKKILLSRLQVARFLFTPIVDDKNNDIVDYMAHDLSYISKYIDGPDKKMVIGASTAPNYGYIENRNLNNIFIIKNINGILTQNGISTGGASDQIVYSKKGNLILANNFVKDSVSIDSSKAKMKLSVIPFRGGKVEDYSKLNFANIFLNEAKRGYDDSGRIPMSNFLLDEKEDRINLYVGDAQVDGKLYKITLSKYIGDDANLTGKCFISTYDFVENNASQPVQCDYEISNSRKNIKNIVAQSKIELEKAKKPRSAELAYCDTLVHDFKKGILSPDNNVTERARNALFTKYTEDMTMSYTSAMNLEEKFLLKEEYDDFKPFQLRDSYPEEYKVFEKLINAGVSASKRKTCFRNSKLVVHWADKVELYEEKYPFYNE